MVTMTTTMMSATEGTTITTSKSYSCSLAIFWSVTSLLASDFGPLSPSAILWPLMTRVGSGMEKEKVWRSGAKEGGGVHWGMVGVACELVRNRASPGLIVIWRMTSWTWRKETSMEINCLPSTPIFPLPCIFPVSFHYLSAHYSSSHYCPPITHLPITVSSITQYLPASYVSLFQRTVLKLFTDKCHM